MNSSVEFSTNPQIVLTVIICMQSLEIDSKCLCTSKPLNIISCKDKHLFELVSVLHTIRMFMSVQ